MYVLTLILSFFSFLSLMATLSSLNGQFHSLLQSPWFSPPSILSFPSNDTNCMTRNINASLVIPDNEWNFLQQIVGIPRASFRFSSSDVDIMRRRAVQVNIVHPAFFSSTANVRNDHLGHIKHPWTNENGPKSHESRVENFARQCKKN